MASNQKTVIVTGASQGIGAAVVKAFLERGYNVVGTSRGASKAGFTPSPNLALVDGDIGQATSAEKVAQTAISKFGSIDHLVNNAGIFVAKPFTDYTAEEFRNLVATNLEGFIFIAQLAVKQMLSQGAGGSVTTITASLADNPIAGLPASIAMITKGGLDAITRSLASEYAKSNIRFNAVAPGVVETPLHKNNPKDFLKPLTRWARQHPRKSTQPITDARPPWQIANVIKVIAQTVGGEFVSMQDAYGLADVT